MDIWADRKRLSRAGFLFFNAAIAAAVVVFLVFPLWARLSARQGAISEQYAQLDHFRKFSEGSRHAGAAFRKTPLLPDGEERVVSADLQASLKELINNAGARSLVIRGLPTQNQQGRRLINIGAEVEGSLRSIRDLLQSIASERPALFIAAITIRKVSNDDQDNVRAEFTLSGALRDRSTDPEGASKVSSDLMKKG
jgi:hypothetical protein